MAKDDNAQVAPVKSGGRGVFWLIWIIFVFGVVLLFDNGSSSSKKETDKETKSNEIIIDGNGIVKKPFIVCFSSKSCKEMSELRMRGDIQGAMYLHKAHECFLLKDGTKVSILEQNILSPSKVRAYMDNGSAVDLYTYFD